MDREKAVDSVFRIAKKGELLSFLKNLALSDDNVAKKLETRFLKAAQWDYVTDTPLTWKQRATLKKRLSFYKHTLEKTALIPTTMKWTRSIMSGQCLKVLLPRENHWQGIISSKGLINFDITVI